jgi:hypothetical protein
MAEIRQASTASRMGRVLGGGNALRAPWKKEAAPSALNRWPDLTEQKRPN